MAENRTQVRRCRQQLLIELMMANKTHVPRGDCQQQHASNVVYSAFNRPFFSAAEKVESDATGPHGNGEPEPNAAAVRRGSLLRMTFVQSTHPPWSFHESKALQYIVSHHHGEKNSNNTTSCQPVSYNHVAQQLAPAAAALAQTSRRRAKALAATAPTTTSTASSIPFSRTAQECELHHLSLQKRRPWTKYESLKLVELAYSGALPWTAIAEKLNGDTVANPGGRRNNSPRTVWECFVQYQTQLRLKPPLQWTPQQDQLLLRYVAAAGPQCVWNSSSSESNPLAVHLSAALLPDKTRSQLLHRIHHSLINPKLSSDPWTADEERKLVVCLKMYHDYFCGPSSLSESATTSGSGLVVLPSTAAAAVSKALNAIAEHHLGNRRSPKSVTDKWKKSLDPGHSSLPFTEQEDAHLVSVAAAFPAMGWAELCRLHFPSRHPERVAKRWAEVATNEQILEREGRTGVGGGGISAVLGSAAMRRATFAKSRKRKQPKGPPEDGSSVLFSTEDFYVQLKKAKKC
jgi:hypothetical protein